MSVTVTKISKLPSIVNSQLTDYIPADQNGVTVKEALLQIMLLFGANIQIASPSQITGLSSITWNNVTSSTQSMVSNNGYVTNNSSSLVTYSLPLSSSITDILYITGHSANGWLIAQAAGQNIVIGSNSSTIGTLGTAQSTNANDSIMLVCTIANLQWTAAVSPQGNILLS